MTADAEQSLPPQIVANISCGEELDLLSSLQGYTANVRTADGKTGYIASVYLKRIWRKSRIPAPLTVSNGVARWQDFTIGCDQFLDADGAPVQSLSLNGITVRVSVHDTGSMFRAEVSVVNNGVQPIDIDPSKFVLDHIGRHGKPLPYQDPAELASIMTHQALWGDVNSSPVNVARRGAPTTTNNGAMTLTYKTPASSAIGATDSSAPREAVERQPVPNQKDQRSLPATQPTLTLALKPGSIPPNDAVSGAVWFNGDKNPQQLVLRIPVDGLVYEFPLPLNQPK